jgi:hypothetical protein
MRTAKQQVIGHKLSISLESMVWVELSLNEEESDPSFQEKCVQAFKELLERREVEFECHDIEEIWGYPDPPPGDFD